MFKCHMKHDIDLNFDWFPVWPSTGTGILPVPVPVLVPVPVPVPAPGVSLRSEVYFVFSRSERIPFRVETCESFLIATTVFVHLVLCYSRLQWSSKDTSSKLLPTKIISYHINDVFNKNRRQPNNPVYSSWDYPLSYRGLQRNQVAKRLKPCVYIFYSRFN